MYIYTYMYIYPHKALIFKHVYKNAHMWSVEKLCDEARLVT